jgi:LysM repeat protein
VTVAVLLVRAGLHAGPAPPRTVATTVSTSTTPTNRRPRFYRLRPGQTLSDVALRFDTSVEELLRLNPRVRPNALRVGQRIRVR